MKRKAQGGEVYIRRGNMVVFGLGFDHHLAGDGVNKADQHSRSACYFPLVLVLVVDNKHVEPPAQ
jgi:hypothetical protein